MCMGKGHTIEGQSSEFHVVEIELSYRYEPSSGCGAFGSLGFRSNT
jgi:hypothetical protein